MRTIRTRYAPSPTGYLHIGGARTALFAYIFAKHYQGEFVVRIEDTDISRNVPGGEDSQIDNLAWLGIIPDESPRKPNSQYGKYRQSEKLDRYHQVVQQLLDQNLAYKAYDSSEELEQQKNEQESKGIPSFRYDRNWLQITEEEKLLRNKTGEYTIRISLRSNVDYTWNDIVRGPITVNTNDIGDYVIIKKDGYPTYNFAVVVDDKDMEITHVLRGEEHITNTPKQIAIYDALGWEIPEFGHFTIITNMDGKKLSKRDLSLKQFIEDYKNEKYHPHAIFNFLTLLGWTHKDAKEILSHEEIIREFNPSRLSKSPSKFDIQKMEWFSKEYIKKSTVEEILNNVTIQNKDHDWIDLFINTYKQNAITYKDIERAENIYLDKSIQAHVLPEIVKVFREQLNINHFTPEGIQKAIESTKIITETKGKDLFFPIRKYTTYQDHGPELAKAIFLCGESLIKARLEQ